MNKILELNADDAYPVVQPGVINNDLDQATRKQGLFYAPDPASKKMSGIYPAMLEAMDSHTLRAVSEFRGSKDMAGRSAVMEDMAVPTSRMAELVDTIQALSDKYPELEIFTAGHAGDGNLHPTVTWSKDAKEMPESVNVVLHEMFTKALELGGTISGEHAVGMLKNQWNNVELGEDVDWIQHQIKSLFDPMNLLNPKRKID